MSHRTVALLTTLAALLLLPAAAQADGTVKAGVAVLDGTYHVGSSAGQYATARVSEDGVGEPGPTDPHAQNIRKQASYGVQARESVRALVIRGGDGKLVALVSDDHYIPQDALLKRTAQLASEQTGGALNAGNITMAVTHNHSSPSYSSLDPGVWTFQDVFDFRFFDYYARQNAAALTKAYNDLHDVRVSATASYFDKIQRNPLGPARADDGAPAGFSNSFSDHDLSVIRFENVDDPAHPKPLSTLVNLGQHPEFLEGVGLITSEFPGALQRFVDRRKGGVTIFTQNATGNSEIEKETYHPVAEREAFDHTMYNQMEWAARQLADGVIANIEDIEAQRPNPDDDEHFGMTSYHDRFIPWMSSFPVALENRWFPGPISHPYPGVNNCRTDPTMAGDVKLGTAADCTDVLGFFGLSPSPVMELLPGAPAVSSDDFEALGIPFPENVSTPSHGALEDTYGVHLQAIRLGDLLLTVCSCEQWTDQAYNIKTRTDRIPDNEWLGFDPTNPPADDKTSAQNSCKQNGEGTYRDDGTGTGTWACTTNPGVKLPDRTIQLMRSRTLNDAAGWDDPACFELGCGVQAESEPTELPKIRGNYTHDDTTVRGGKAQTADYAATHGYKMVVTISMANDYNGYIATYRDYMGRDHYRKALTGWGPHSSDYFATRLARLGHALKGDPEAQQAIDQETDPAKAGPGYHPGAVKEVADQQAEEAKVRAVGEAAHAATEAYGATIPDDSAGSPGDVVQPKDIKRFDAATFTWVGGNNYTDNPEVVVERKVGDTWRVFADQSGEVPTTVAYPNGGDPSEAAAYRTGGQVWKWTATFEAFVSRFRVVDPSGEAYRATPAGTYRFRVRGVRRQGGADAQYAITSREFDVAPWDGLTVEQAKLDALRHVTFGAGPSRTVTESRIRGTETPNLGQQSFTIGPVDFPDFARDQAATGVLYFNKARGYSAQSLAQKDDAEHYCLDCRFRDWLDATGKLRATVTFLGRQGRVHAVERIRTTDGTFRTERQLGPYEHAEITIQDHWGNTTAEPVTVGG
jgi:hypothetical protein